EASGRIQDFQELAATRPMAPKHNHGPFAAETKVTIPDCGTPLALSNQPEVGTGASLGLARHPAIAGFSGASRRLRPQAPKYNQQAFPSETKTPVLGGRLWDLRWHYQTSPKLALVPAWVW
uniref:Uncharacterized protein n=1 Tax=Geospiza parvula TaxID=87175 RepID=A0A8U8BFQ5_GEOPR